MQNQIKNFDEFKNKFLKQKIIKKEQLKQLFLSGKKDFIINKNETQEDNKIKAKEDNKIKKYKIL